MEGWKEYKIKDIIEEISMGPFGSNIKRDCYVDSGIPYLTGSNLRTCKLNEDTFYFVTEEKAMSLGRCVAQRGDIIVTHRGTIGQISYIPYNSHFEKYLTGNSQFRFRVDIRKIRPDFLTYFFHTRIGQHLLLSNASQVGVPALARPTSTFKELSIPVPPMDIQNGIMDMVLSLDDKIEVNRRINENLEAQAQALFKSWFVDFEPFKDGEFVESELGMIPKGWRVGKLSDISYYSKEKIRINTLDAESYYSTENMLPNKGGVTKASNLPNIEYTTKCQSGEILVSNIRPYFKKIFYCNREVAGCSADVLCFVPTKKTLSIYLYLLLYDDKFFEYMIMGAKGTKMPRGDKQQIMNYNVMIPDDDAINKFTEIVSPFFKKKECNDQVSRRLATLRDTLLPRLMSGELKVNEIEKSL